MEIKCRVCAQPVDPSNVTDLSDTYLNYKKTPTQYLYCSSCETLFQWPSISDSELSSYYPKIYYTRSGPAKKSYLSKLREYIIRKAIDPKTHIPFVYKLPVYILSDKFLYILPTKIGYGLKFLDFGCGNGDNLRLLSQYGWICKGIEIDQEHIKSLRSEGLDVEALSTDGFKTEVYDSIRLWHVLEHLNTPVETLKMLSGALAVNGRIYLAVPNYNSFYRFIFGEYWIGADAPRHVFSFTKKSIQYITTLCNLNIVKIITRSSGGFAQSLNNLYKRYINKKGSKFLNSTIATIAFYPVDFISDFFKCGDIYYVVLEKRDAS